tara:strand:- start:4338 stop:4988 length:651 start_codon:yes stop_codon:yes gene_type:complete
MKGILSLSDCELMHMRTSGQLEYQKRGNAYLYTLPNDYSLLQHPLGQQLLNWHVGKHPQAIDNTPSGNSKYFLELLVAEILLPVERVFGALTISYGFTSSELTRYIKKQASNGTAPALDQHASCEHNLKGNQVCERGGSACDFIVQNGSMANVARFITQYLRFDRIYYYGDTRPMHVSVNYEPMRHLQVMSESAAGRRIPGRKAFGDAAINLSKGL